MPSHTHNVQVPGYNSSGETTWESTQDRRTCGMYNKTTTATGSNAAFGLIPSFYVLTYIMKL
jgi:hypothetical protein